MKESKERPDIKAIWQYLFNKLASNTDEDHIRELPKGLVSKNALLHKSKARGDSYEILSEEEDNNEFRFFDLEPEVSKRCK